MSHSQKQSRPDHMFSSHMSLKALEERQMLAIGFNLISDINALPVSLNPADIVVVGSVAFSRPRCPPAEPSSRKTDGTQAGTKLVKDIRTGLLSSSPSRLTGD